MSTRIRCDVMPVAQAMLVPAAVLAVICSGKCAAQLSQQERGPKHAAEFGKGLIAATPWRHKPRHLLRDRDAVYGRDFRQRARRLGIDAIATPVRSPRANAVAERVIGTLRRECLDHLIILDEHHLSSVLREFVAFYSRERPHRTLGLHTPEAKRRPINGPIQSRLVLGGLHHVYPLATLGGSATTAIRVNGAGQAVGASTIVPGQELDRPGAHAVLWDTAGGRVIDLGTCLVGPTAAPTA